MTNWIKIGHLDEADCDFTSYDQTIGIYKAIKDEELVYIGKATELNNGGFRKRLRDYTRHSDSARNYPSGVLMNQHQNDIVIFILEMDSIEQINQKEIELIGELNPCWNECDN